MIFGEDEELGTRDVVEVVPSYVKLKHMIRPSSDLTGGPWWHVTIRRTDGNSSSSRMECWQGENKLRRVKRNAFIDCECLSIQSVCCCISHPSMSNQRKISTRPNYPHTSPYANIHPRLNGLARSRTRPVIGSVPPCPFLSLKSRSAQVFGASAFGTPASRASTS